MFVIAQQLEQQMPDAKRLSYVIWQQGVAPFFVVELVSPTRYRTGRLRTNSQMKSASPQPNGRFMSKFYVFPTILCLTGRLINLRGLRLEGTRYQELSLANQRLWLEDIQQGLGVWQGSYEKITGLWLRWYDANNRWILTFTQQVEQERQRAEQKRQRAFETSGIFT